MKVDARLSFPQALFCFLEQDRKYCLIIGRRETKKGRDGTHILKKYNAFILALVWLKKRPKNYMLIVTKFLNNHAKHHHPPYPQGSALHHSLSGWELGLKVPQYTGSVK